MAAASCDGPGADTTTSAVAARAVAIRAWGSEAGGEHPRMELLSGDDVVAAWTVTGQPEIYEAIVPAADDDAPLRVAFINDFQSPDADRNLTVEWIRVEGVTVRTDSPEVRSVGSWTPDTGCDPGFKRSPVLHCEGYFEVPPQVAVELGPSGLAERPANPTCVAPPRPAAGIALVPAFPALPALDQPVALTQAADDPGRWFVVERGGRVRSFAAAADASELTTVLDITERVNPTIDAGLLGFALHPRFVENGEAFLSYTTWGGPSGSRSRVSRVRSTDGGATLDPATEEVMIEFDQPTDGIHKNADVHFGPDGLLYLAFGDGGPQRDPEGNGQNPDVLLGKMLRLDVDGARPYAIPPDNPFALGGGAPEIYALGFRNPWRWSFDRETGALWLGDVGNDAREEVDRVVLGGNYGWPLREGTACLDLFPCDLAGLVDPVVEYDHGQGSSITGGYVYRGAALPALVGIYLYADFVGGTIWGVPAAGGEPAVLVESGRNVAAFGEGLDGELFVVDFDGTILRVVDGGDGGDVPARLSETGCVDPADPTAPAPGLIPFDVNAPLWSDGADKRRWIALPDGAQLHVAADGDLELPTGTVLVKEFARGGRRLETRLFVRHDDGEWGGYTYAWNEDGTDADLLVAGETRVIDGQPWTFPARAECMSCHTAAAGRALGPELAQLNRTLVYPGGVAANQLATLAHIGLFDAPLPAPPDELPALAGLASEAPVVDRARAYLHANCSGCHRPGGPGRGGFDLRAATPWADVGVCGQPPTLDDLGVDGAALVAPGDPARSVVPLRMRATGPARMPPLATSVVDDAGVGAVEAFVADLAGCP